MRKPSQKPQRHAVANPRLGTLYAIFTSAIVGCVTLMIIGERLGLDNELLRYATLSIPLLLAVALAILSTTNSIVDFFTCGNRVPASFSGFNLAITAIGGTGILSLSGLFFLAGFDALCLTIGWCLGFVFLALIFAPMVKTKEAQSLPVFFENHFHSPAVAITAAALVLPIAALILFAELKIGIYAASLVSGLPTEIICLTFLAFILLTTLPGGMRSLTWSNAAYCIVAIVSFVIPLTIVSVLLTNLPLPQFTYGTLLTEIDRIELNFIATQPQENDLATSLSATAPQQIEKLFSQNFGAISEINFYLLAICFACGTAVLPTLLMRANTVNSLHNARRSAGWGLLLAGIFLTSAPAYAIFSKYIMLQELVGSSIDQLPAWARDITNLRLVEIRDQEQNASVDLKDLFVSRDGITLLLPILAGLPVALFVMIGTGALAATIASASAQLFAMGSSLSSAIDLRSQNSDTTSNQPILISRITMVIFSIAALWFASQTSYDSLWLLTWALSLSAATFFAPLFLSLIIRNFPAQAALASMLTGFTATALYIAMTPTGENGIIASISHTTAAVIGLPISFAAGLILNAVTAKPEDAPVQQPKTVKAAPQQAPSRPISGIQPPTQSGQL